MLSIGGKKEVWFRSVLREPPHRKHTLLRSRDTIARSGSHARVGADHKTYQTYLNSTQNAIFYNNMDEIMAVIACQMRLYGAQLL